MGEAGAAGDEVQRGDVWLGACKHPSQRWRVTTRPRTVESRVAGERGLRRAWTLPVPAPSPHFSWQTPGLGQEPCCWHEQAGLFLGSHPCPDGAPNQWQRHGTGGWSRPRVADGGRQVGNSNHDIIPNIHRRRQALSRHRKGQSQGLKVRRGPPAPGPSPRAGRRGPH